MDWRRDCALLDLGIKKLTVEFSDTVDKLLDEWQEDEMLNRIVTNMANLDTQENNCHRRRLYDKYKTTIKNYISSMVLPLPDIESPQSMLGELVKRWSKYKILVNRVSEWFNCLELDYTATPPSLKEDGLRLFRDMVYEKLPDGVFLHIACLISEEDSHNESDGDSSINLEDACWFLREEDALINFDLDLDEGSHNQFARHRSPQILATVREIIMGPLDWFAKSAEEWANIQERVKVGINAIISSVEAGWKYEKKDLIALYSVVYYVYTKRTESLKSTIRTCFDCYISATVVPCLQTEQDEGLLWELFQRWENHKLMFNRLVSAFGIVDRRYSLKDFGLACFRELVYLQFNIKVRETVISLIDREREGEAIDKILLARVIRIFDKMGMDTYEDDFEAFMLNKTSVYYSLKALEMIASSCTEYILQIKECSRKEGDRAKNYLLSSSKTKLLERVGRKLTERADQVLEKESSGLAALFNDDKVGDLSEMYTVFSRIPKASKAFAGVFKQHVIAALVEQTVKPSSRKIFVRKVIELREKYLVLVNKCFKNRPLFYRVLEEALQVFCDRDVAGSSSAEFLATFCDNILKKDGNGELSDEAFEETLEQVVKFLEYISDKDLFAEFHWKKLALRLLFDKSANLERERSILTNLKRCINRDLTRRMERMVTDMTLAPENRTSLKEYLRNNSQADPGIGLTVTILTSEFWPSYKSSALNLPVEMVRCVDVFQEFYKTITSGRKLTIIYSLGTCNVIGNFAPKTIELIVTTYQASALLLFKTSDRLSYQEIMEQLNLTDEDVVRLLHSLSCDKYRILLKDPPTDSISPTDVFQFNTTFTDKMRRIKIARPPEDEKKNVTDVFEDRRYAIDAKIVRTMKNRKSLGYQQLVVECDAHFKGMFKVDAKTIKKRIEDLITREFLKRDENNRKLLIYLP